MSGLEYADYRRAPMCLVYLEDVVYPHESGDFMTLIQNISRLKEAWALQELLASKEITFYSREAIRLCTKSDILQSLSLWTKIDVDILEDPAKIRDACIAKRMFWAAGRQSRLETDVVQSLKGIFDVKVIPYQRNNTPKSVFCRLQFRLMKMYPGDLSIFAWRAQEPVPSASHGRLLADSPSEFASCHRINLITPCSRLLQAPLHTVKDWGQSKWFRHTYTLPELVASNEILFFTNTWTPVGFKSNLCKELSSITGIDEAVLRDREKVQNTSVAKRMSWASQRIPQKNRWGRPIEEESAHCLMGIFHVPKLAVHLTIGLKAAMLLLQQEIMKEYPKDLSIFEWQHTDVNDPGTNGVLAGSPFQFRFCGEVESFDNGSKIELVENSDNMFSINGLVISQDLDRIGLVLNSYHNYIRPRVYPLILLSKEPPKSRESTKVGCYRTDVGNMCYISPGKAVTMPTAQGLIYICKDGAAFFQGAVSPANPADLWGGF
ncbi:hypothetical protein BDV27DRAFT_152080 [Aspergillus caelatus]|uniref:Heterokaryon incompatibility domain-containing protein n=1 Tax=Aspergillus caelatus TaxID=61420 RepID=A0A5N7AML8_9EURO|nr:uncharacterized protein BDV27DRAFT_152080 [Aspergillus caelatus]KAE8370486.1 hypothetical protein BDV27DRAFT_152080 [Aspergillus caelatus]